jgi:hypothetical protein
MKQPTREDELSFLENCLKGGGGGALSWEVWRWEKGRNEELAGRGSERLESVWRAFGERVESDGGIWGDEMAGEICLQTRVKWRAGCGEELLGEANRQGRPASAKPAQRSAAGLSNQG